MCEIILIYHEKLTVDVDVKRLPNIQSTLYAAFLPQTPSMKVDVFWPNYLDVLYPKDSDLSQKFADMLISSNQEKSTVLWFIPNCDERYEDLPEYKRFFTEVLEKVRQKYVRFI